MKKATLRTGPGRAAAGTWLEFIPVDDDAK